MNIGDYSIESKARAKSCSQKQKSEKIINSRMMRSRKDRPKSLASQESDDESSASDTEESDLRSRVFPKKRAVKTYQELYKKQDYQHYLRRMIELKQFFLANPDYILIFSKEALKLVSTTGRVTLAREKFYKEINYRSTLRQLACFVKRKGCDGKVISYDRLNYAS